METGIFIKVHGETVDIGDPTLDIVVLDVYIGGLTEFEKDRLIMTLLKRREEFDHYLEK